MNYTEKQFNTAVSNLTQKKQRNEETAKKRKEEILRKFPEYEKYDAILRNTGVNIAMNIIAHDMDAMKKLERENLDAQEKIKLLLVRNGYPDTYLKPIYSCEKCKDTFLFEGKHCQCLTDELKKVAGDELNKSAPMVLSSFDTFSLTRYSDKRSADSGLSAFDIMSTNLSICRQYAEDFHYGSGGILMRGGTGLGKTHLSLAIAHEVIDKGYNVLYGSAPDFFRKIEQENFSNEKSTVTYDLLTSADLLILDDLGAEFDSRFNVSTLYSLINTRINMRKSTIISTNLTAAEMKKRYGDSITSRLYSMETLDFVGRDLRLSR